MPQAGFTDVHGEKWRFSEIDPVADAHRFNCSPATLAMLIDAAQGRKGIDFSASQLSNTPRQHLLRTREYYPTTGQMMAAHMGTLKHAQINVERDNLIVEQRFTSRRNPRLSGQIDHAAIIELTDDTLLVDLYDLKTVKWYSTTLIAKDVWKHHPDYAWQLNLCAAMMEESLPHEVDAVLGDVNGNLPYALLNAVRIKVRNLYLECIPADSSYKNIEEAQKLGFPEFQKQLVQIERRSADETYAVYEEAMRLRDEAIAAGYAPLCAERWTNRNVDNLRCRHFCDVRDECIAFAHERGESHPIAPLDVALQASIQRAEAANA
jgi:hypothetical protein